MNRTAIDAIIGYFYQFDYSIEQLLLLQNNTDKVTLEGIEDIDIARRKDLTAAQCKYYEKTEYNHSVISKPIRHMLTHFKLVKTGHSRKVKYFLYGHFKAGQHKFNSPVTLSILKETFLTYKENGVRKLHHEELELSDHELDEFIRLLHININAKSYDEQMQNIFALLKDHFKCSDFEAENFYYNNALATMKELSTKRDVSERTISKKSFVSVIDSKSILFNRWFVELKGRQNHFRQIRKQYFSRLNISPFERFFLIEVPDDCERANVKRILYEISNKWSKISRRSPEVFCPYVYLYNMTDSELICLKKIFS